MKKNPNCTRWPYPKAILNVTRVTSRLDDLLCMQSSKSKQTITALWAVWPYQGWQIKRSTISAYENEIELIFFISFTQKKKKENYFDVFVYLVLPQGRRKKKMKKKKKVVRTKIPAFVALDHTQLLIDNTRGPHRLASSPGTSHFPSTRDLPLRFSRYFQYLVPNFSLPFFFSLLPIFFFLFVSVIISKNPEIYTKITFKF